MAAPRVAPEKRPSVMKGHILVQAHAGDGGGGIEHLPHAGAAPGPFVADDHHVTGHDLSGVDGGDGLVLTVEHPGGAGVDQHLRRYGGPLYHGAVRRQVSPSTASPPVFVYGRSRGRITSGSRFSAWATFSPRVFPVTVIQLPSIIPPSSSSFMTAEMPPACSRSSI